MKQVGYVVAVTGPVAEVAVGEHFDCNKCGACLATVGKKRREIKATNGIGAGVGDKVEVETAPRFAVTAAFLVYIFPLMAIALGALLGYHLLPAVGLRPAAGAALAGGVSLAGSILALWYIEKVYFSRRMPNIVSVLCPGDLMKGGPNSRTDT